MVAQNVQTQQVSGQNQVSDDKLLRHQIVIVGGGTAGITVAAQLTKGFFNQIDVVILDPASNHFYQPAWTLVGGGTYVPLGK
jgi:sulfide:quinone oxidoreductase